MIKRGILYLLLKMVNLCEGVGIDEEYENWEISDVAAGQQLRRIERFVNMEGIHACPSHHFRTFVGQFR